MTKLLPILETLSRDHHTLRPQSLDNDASRGKDIPRRPQSIIPALLNAPHAAANLANHLGGIRGHEKLLEALLTLPERTARPDMHQLRRQINHRQTIQHSRLHPIKHRHRIQTPRNQQSIRRPPNTNSPHQLSSRLHSIKIHRQWPTRNPGTHRRHRNHMIKPRRRHPQIRQQTRHPRQQRPQRTDAHTTQKRFLHKPRTTTLAHLNATTTGHTGGHRSTSWIWMTISAGPLPPWRMSGPMMCLWSSSGKIPASTRPSRIALAVG